MPQSYIRCVAEEGKCPLRETCLRSVAHREADHSEETMFGVTVVNLWNDSLHTLTTECKAYRKANIRTFARGFTQLFHNVPSGIYATVRQQVVGVFSNRQFFFLSQKGKRLTSPSEQEKIAEIFKRNGISAPPQYDEFVELYDWS